jgi:hypothetical protein
MSELTISTLNVVTRTPSVLTPLISSMPKKKKLRLELSPIDLHTTEVLSPLRVPNNSPTEWFNPDLSWARHQFEDKDDSFLNLEGPLFDH